MICPFCGCKDSNVIDTRSIDEGLIIKRRRKCYQCDNRFTTYEQIEAHPLYVIKKDGSSQVFDREKLLRGVWKSCVKRPITPKNITDLVDQIENIIEQRPKREISSQEIGELIINGLRKIDEVAYIRFASVYRDFEDAESFLQELVKLRNGE